MGGGMMPFEIALRRTAGWWPAKYCLVDETLELLRKKGFDDQF
jgi:hypothetical protein